MVKEEFERMEKVKKYQDQCFEEIEKGQEANRGFVDRISGNVMWASRVLLTTR